MGTSAPQMNEKEPVIKARTMIERNKRPFKRKGT